MRIIPSTYLPNPSICTHPPLLALYSEPTPPCRRRRARITALSPQPTIVTETRTPLITHLRSFIPRTSLTRPLLCPFLSLRKATKILVLRKGPLVLALDRPKCCAAPATSSSGVTQPRFVPPPGSHEWCMSGTSTPQLGHSWAQP